MLRHVRYSLGKQQSQASAHDVFMAASLAVRDVLIDRMFETEARYQAADAKRVYYLSLEFLIGRSLGSNLQALGILELGHRALHELGIDVDEVREAEPDAGLGNGGLGRLAACFLDSLATLGMPGFGYGINYEYGLFRQVIEGGHQREKPDGWRSLGTPWLVERSEEACLVPVYGRVEHASDRHGNDRATWVDWRVIVGVPHDMPIVGHGGRTVNTLRLYSARASSEFDIEIFNRGDYVRAVEEKMHSERISKVLYPADSYEAGKELRLLQEYFFVACAIRDIFTHYLRKHTTFDAFPDHVAIQMNDTHPALAVAELMRMFIDQHRLPWERAFELTVRTLGYTNHTLLPEALEKWPQPLLGRILPRHLEIIERINLDFLSEVNRRWPGDVDRLRRMSIIEEGQPKQIRMGHLAIVGSHSVNGVARLHTELLRTRVIPDFDEFYPGRIQNKTNGITPRRWLLRANPGLSHLVESRIGRDWITDLDRLRELESHAEDPAFREEFREVKRANKVRLEKLVLDLTRVSIDADSIFDVQVKRIHEYKRQLLFVLRTIHHYLRIVEDGFSPARPLACLLAGKAAPEYFMAKLVIKLVNNVGQIVNADPAAAGWLRIAFVPDYRVSLAEAIIPAADVSEQISTAGKEASGTGNMKFALNGALTLGTLDGANVEIREAVGDENIYIFGLRVEEVERLRESGGYDPRALVRSNPEIARVVECLENDRFSPREHGIFRPIWESLMVHGDPYFVLADFASYVETADRAARDFEDRESWTRRAILNVARMGHFSSDRTIRDYASEIWGIHPVR
ncbi:glycogen phosphorylase [Myxococcaceae bacterium]|nr:glycogen phosphorylase [Myxococcaceae bacterium]